jgi:hypothetical protein
MTRDRYVVMQAVQVALPPSGFVTTTSVVEPLALGDLTLIVIDVAETKVNEFRVQTALLS